LSLVLSENDSGAAVITLCNSAQGNVLSSETVQALSEALGAAMADAAVRVVLLRSDGEAFCRGMDFSEVTPGADASAEAEKKIALYASLLQRIVTAPKPILCFVNGPVIAGGVGLVGACDIVVATPEATLQLSEVFWGLIPANVIPFVAPARLSPHAIRYLVLTGKKISAGEALRLGLVDEVFPEQTVEKELKAIIKNLFRASPAALARAKRYTHELFGAQLDAALPLARATLLEMLQNPDVRGAINDFKEGGAPKWFARFSPQRSLTGSSV
jgi:enoyl-CoA hydratase/carnithine racemase